MAVAIVLSVTPKSTAIRVVRETGFTEPRGLRRDSLVDRWVRHLTERCLDRVAHERELGLRQRGTTTFVYAEKRREERPLTAVTIEIGNLSTQTEAIMGPTGSQVLIGQLVLEALTSSPTGRRGTLTPRHPEEQGDLPLPEEHAKSLRG